MASTRTGLHSQNGMDKEHKLIRDLILKLDSLELKLDSLELKLDSPEFELGSSLSEMCSATAD